MADEQGKANVHFLPRSSWIIHPAQLWTRSEQETSESQFPTFSHPSFIPWYICNESDEGVKSSTRIFRFEKRSMDGKETNANLLLLCAFSRKIERFKTRGYIYIYISVTVEYSSGWKSCTRIILQRSKLIKIVFRCGNNNKNNIWNRKGTEVAQQVCQDCFI